MVVHTTCKLSLMYIHTMLSLCPSHASNIHRPTIHTKSLSLFAISLFPLTYSLRSPTSNVNGKSTLQNQVKLKITRKRRPCHPRRPAQCQKSIRRIEVTRSKAGEGHRKAEQDSDQANICPQRGDHVQQTERRHRDQEHRETAINPRRIGVCIDSIEERRQCSPERHPEPSKREEHRSRERETYGVKAKAWLLAQREGRHTARYLPSCTIIGRSPS